MTANQNQENQSQFRGQFQGLCIPGNEVWVRGFRNAMVFNLFSIKKSHLFDLLLGRHETEIDFDTGDVTF